MRPSRGVWYWPSLLLLLVAVAGLGGCSSAAWQSPTSEVLKPRLVVITTTSLVSGLVRDVAGDRVEVRQIVPPGADAVAYRPPASVTGLLDGADVTFHHGLGLETGLGSFLAVAAGTGPVVGVADTIPPDRLLPPDGNGTAVSAAVWLDPALWTLALERVTDALVDLDPGAADTYRARTSAAGVRYAELSRYLAGTFAMVPGARRVVATTDGGLSYLLAPHGFTVAVLPSTASRPWPTAAEAGLIADAAIGTGAAVVLVPARTQASANAVLTSALSERGSRVSVLPVTLDSLGRAGSLEADYEATMRGLSELIMVALVVEGG
ncbi:MAG: zinc ABC transporter substrate-binding protein [Chloroflexia bacterium]|nr:zinc ABC transporter substrate-binding protein [Chloroflexia bacterium]